MLTHVSIFVLFGSSLASRMFFFKTLWNTRDSFRLQWDDGFSPSQKFVAGSYAKKIIPPPLLHSGLEGRVGSGSWCGWVSGVLAFRSLSLLMTNPVTNKQLGEPVTGLLSRLLFPWAPPAVGKSPRGRRESRPSHDSERHAWDNINSFCDVTRDVDLS